MRRNRSITLLAMALLAVLALPVAGNPEGLAGHPLLEWLDRAVARPGAEHPTGYYTFIDENGEAILRTAHTVRRGDLFIDPSDGFHRVTRVVGDIVHTVLEPSPPSPGSGSVPFEPRLWSTALSELGASPADGRHDLAIPLGQARHVILIYHSHSDESYLPTDGRSAIPANGGIYDVGETMATSLSAAGFTVIHDRTAHDPHDSGAYPRSRRTVRRNLQFGPTLLFDVHRDASPAAEYLTTVDGIETSSILFVVGGANPLRSANLALARRLSAISEELYPGIVRGILIGRGNYNQDLDPGAMLLEMGTYLIRKEAAQKTAVLWANVVSAFLGPPGPEGVPSASEDQ
jgi:stage II sporulation protein P